ncbi:hypothetical protein Scep_006589 [Stephania cephalantha]|uniref:Uncharacterized protein n=1 Tax=Stephania cephalantha TaxID=152367 RepID=A0AAP0PKZ3_9MAGN
MAARSDWHGRSATTAHLEVVWLSVFGREREWRESPGRRDGAGRRTAAAWERAARRSDATVETIGRDAMASEASSWGDGPSARVLAPAVSARKLEDADVAADLDGWRAGGCGDDSDQGRSGEGESTQRTAIQPEIRTEEWRDGSGDRRVDLAGGGAEQGRSADLDGTRGRGSGWDGSRRSWTRGGADLAMVVEAG